MNQLNPEEYLEERDRAFSLMRKANLYVWPLKNCEIELGCSDRNEVKYESS